MMISRNQDLPTRRCRWPQRPWLVDTTLRDGEQTPGVAFSHRDRIRIAVALVEAGVKELEVGTPAMGNEDAAAIRALKRLQSRARLTAWCRAAVKDVEQAARSGVSAVHVSVPTSAVQLAAIGKSAAWAIDQLIAVTKFARRHFDYVSVAGQDASRADQGFLSQCAAAAASVGADRFRLADTVGRWNPRQVAEAISRIRCSAPEIEIGFHGHNDLGLATANSLAAIEARADSVDVTVGGLGERAGNAALEQVVMATRLTLDVDVGVRSEALAGLCRLVASAAGRPISDDRPIVGSRTFRHESGIHVHSVLKDPRSFEPFAPEEVGRVDRALVFGRHSGSAGLVWALRKAGIEVDRAEAERLLPLVRAVATRLRRSLQISDLAALHRDLAGNSQNKA